MPENDRDVFKLLYADGENPSHTDLMAFTLFFFEKEEWCVQFEQKFGHPPNQTDMDRFTGDYTPERLARLKVDAASFFDAAARDYLASEIEDEKKKTLESALLTEMKRSNSFWRQFGLAIITSILAPLVLALLLFALSHVRDIPSASDLAAGLRSPQTSPSSSK